MRTVSLIPIFCICFSVTYGQVSDSLSVKMMTISGNLNSDSLQQNLHQLPDTLLRPMQRLDSMRSEFTLEAHRMQQKYLHAVAEVEVKTKTLNITIDSLQKLNLPTGNYTRKADSLQQLKNNLESNYKSKFDSLKFKTIGRLQSLDLPPEYNEPLQKLTRSITDFDSNTDIANIPSFEIPGYSLPKMKGLDGLTSKVGEVGNIENTIKLPEVQTSAGDLDNIGAQAGAYQEDLKNITQGNLQDVEKLPETIQAQASQIDGIDELKKQTGVIDAQKAKLDELAELNDPAKAKEKAVAVAKEKAVDHFAGKQEQLKSAMDKISKYKTKIFFGLQYQGLAQTSTEPDEGETIH